MPTENVTSRRACTVPKLLCSLSTTTALSLGIHNSHVFTHVSSTNDNPSLAASTSSSAVSARARATNDAR